MAWLVYRGAPAVFATIIGAATGSVFNYVFQFYWTFSGKGSHSKAIPVYAGTAILSWIINAGAFYFLISVTHVGYGFAQLCATAVVAVMNFILYKRIVFHERIK